jgi:hypothetical protein
VLFDNLAVLHRKESRAAELATLQERLLLPSVQRINRWGGNARWRVVAHQGTKFEAT